MWGPGNCLVLNDALQANVFIDLPGTIRKDGLCTPADCRGGVGPLLALRVLLEGRECRSEEFGMMKFGNRPPVERGRLDPLEGHFRVLSGCVLGTICPHSTEIEALMSREYALYDVNKYSQRCREHVHRDI